jgi:hypothetical protein
MFVYKVVCLYIWLFVYMAICLYVWLYVCIYGCLFVYMVVCLYILLYVCIYGCMFCMLLFNSGRPNPFEITLLQTTRKENNWKNEETLERAVVTLETEQIKGSNP